MAKIVLVEQDKVSIGMDDGAIKEVRTDDLNFVPHVGDEVEVFETKSRTIISKKEQKKMLCQKEEFTSICPMHRTSAPGRCSMRRARWSKNWSIACWLSFWVGQASINFMRGASVPVSFTCCSAGQEFRQLSLLSSLSSACAKRRMQQEILWSKQKNSPDGEFFSAYEIIYFTSGTLRSRT